MGVKYLGDKNRQLSDNAESGEYTPLWSLNTKIILPLFCKILYPGMCEGLWSTIIIRENVI
jgi:hypothetical protein